MKCLVTGANGFIGFELTKELLKQNYEVNVLVRREFKFPDNDKLSVFRGDLSNVETINKAMKECDVVFHLAAYANIWSKDKTLAYKTNVVGTKNILESALKNKIGKVIFTSSAATLPPSKTDEIIDETFQAPDEYLTEYETTKQQAEQFCIEYYKKGLNVVIVNPSRVYGPGFLNKSNSLTILIKKYLEGKWRIIPGDGKQIGNYVFIDDVVHGHIKAMDMGIAGEQYILGGENVSYNQFFSLLSEVSKKRFKLFHLPMFLMLIVGKFELFMAENFGKKPLITTPWVKRYQQNRPLSNRKSMNELHCSFTLLHEGFEKTIKWIKSNYGK